MAQAVKLVPSTIASRARCRLCECRLGGKGDDLAISLCVHCLDRPEAAAIRNNTSRGQLRPPREFTVADKELIRRIHVHLPAAQLLSLLNERLRADHGDALSPYTLEQLNAYLRTLRATANTQDWANLRKLLRDARAEGVAQSVTAQLIDDFAVVFSLTPAQVHRLRDVLLSDDASET